MTSYLHLFAYWLNLEQLKYIKANNKEFKFNEADNPRATTLAEDFENLSLVVLSSTCEQPFTKFSKVYIG